VGRFYVCALQNENLLAARRGGRREKCGALAACDKSKLLTSTNCRLNNDDTQNLNLQPGRFFVSGD
jgi:hypothetical protein